MVGNNPFISVVIVTWNRKDEVLNALNSVLNQDYKNFEVVIVDNFSIDGTYEAINEIARQHSNIKLIRTYKNLGCPIARNMAFVNCSGDIIFSLDDDAIMDRECLKKVVDTFNNFPNAAVVSCNIIEENDKRENKNNVGKTGLFCGCAFAIKKEIINQVGLFPEYFRQAEETYLALKILDKGYDIIYNPDCKVYHKPSPKGRVKYIIVYYGFKHDIENVFRLLPLHYALPISFYKTLIHAKNYYKNKFFHLYFFDTIRVLINGISKVRKEKEKIRIATFLKFRMLGNG